MEKAEELCTARRDYLQAAREAKTIFRPENVSSEKKGGENVGSLPATARGGEKMRP